MHKVYRGHGPITIAGNVSTVQVVAGMSVDMEQVVGHVNGKAVRVSDCVGKYDHLFTTGKGEKPSQADTVADSTEQADDTRAAQGRGQRGGHNKQQAHSAPDSDKE